MNQQLLKSIIMEAFIVFASNKKIMYSLRRVFIVYKNRFYHQSQTLKKYFCVDIESQKIYLLNSVDHADLSNLPEVNLDELIVFWLEVSSFFTSQILIAKTEYLLSLADAYLKHGIPRLLGQNGFVDNGVLFLGFEEGYLHLSPKSNITSLVLKPTDDPRDGLSVDSELSDLAITILENLLTESQNITDIFINTQIYSSSQLVWFIRNFSLN